MDESQVHKKTKHLIEVYYETEGVRKKQSSFKWQLYEIKRFEKYKRKEKRRNK